MKGEERGQWFGCSTAKMDQIYDNVDNDYIQLHVPPKLNYNYDNYHPGNNRKSSSKFSGSIARMYPDGILNWQGERFEFDSYGTGGKSHCEPVFCPRLIAERGNSRILMSTCYASATDYNPDKTGQ